MSHESIQFKWKVIKWVLITTSDRTVWCKLEDAVQLSSILIDVSEWDAIDGEIDEEEFDLSDDMGDDWHKDLWKNIMFYEEIMLKLRTNWSVLTC